MKLYPQDKHFIGLVNKYFPGVQLIVDATKESNKYVKGKGKICAPKPTSKFKKKFTDQKELF